MKRICFFILLLLIGCKKNEPYPLPVDPIVSPTTGSRFEMTIDSIFLYAKQLYLWNEALPSYADFAPRSKYIAQASAIASFRQELFDITQLSKNPKTGKPFEYPVHPYTPKYSFIAEKGDIPSLLRASGTKVVDAVLQRSILAHPHRKIGYLALNAFPVLNDVKAAYDEAFHYFAAAAVDEMVIDLRINNGGYVETAAYIANLLAPQKLKGKLMFTQVFNKQMQEGKATILAYQPYLDTNGKTVSYKGRAATLADVDYSLPANTKYFAPAGILDGIRKIFFITSAQTSSAAELLISIMKPYMDISIVGQRSYGKPIGFFSLKIDNYTLFLSSFHLLNAEGWNDYFDGMTPTVPCSINLHPNSWGDPEDSAIKIILMGADLSNQQMSMPLKPMAESGTILIKEQAILMEATGLRLKKD